MWMGRNHVGQLREPGSEERAQDWSPRASSSQIYLLALPLSSCIPVTSMNCHNCESSYVTFITWDNQTQFVGLWAVEQYLVHSLKCHHLRPSFLLWQDGFSLEESCQVLKPLLG